MTHKQVIVIRKDLKMRRGKEIAQGAHASMMPIVLNPEDPRIKPWLAGLFTKVCVYVNSEDELKEIYFNAGFKGVLCSLVQDSGLTEFKGIPTLTAVAIGPDLKEKVDEITGHLPLY